MVDPKENGVHLKKNYSIRINRISVEALRLKLAADTISYLESAIAKRVARIFLPRIEMR